MKLDAVFCGIEIKGGHHYLHPMHHLKNRVVHSEECYKIEPIYTRLLYLKELDILFFNYSFHSILFCISLRYTAWWLDSHILYKVFPQYF